VGSHRNEFLSTVSHPVAREVAQGTWLYVEWLTTQKIKALKGKQSTPLPPRVGGIVHIY